MVKGIINDFDHLELSLVINLTKGSNWAITWPPIFATRYVCFATALLYQVASTCYLQKTLISNTACCVGPLILLALFLGRLCHLSCYVTAPKHFIKLTKFYIFWHSSILE